MAKIPKQIIGTPFKSTSPLVLKRINMRIRKLEAEMNLNKQNIKDTIEANGLPRPIRPGRIE